MSSKRIKIRPADDRILKALGRFHYLTAKQICRFLYTAGSLSYAQSSLKRLSDASFCQRIHLPRPTQHGSAPSVYTLGRLGVKWLKEQGIDTPRRLRPKEERQHSYLFLQHSLDTADFLIAAELVTRKVPEITLHTMLHERDLKSRPDYVLDGDGKHIAVIPDGWLDFRINDSTQMCVCLELDRGSEWQKQWRRKVKALLLWNDCAYQERFNTTSLTIAVVAIPGNKRMKDLLHWTESELKDPRNPAADLFRITCASPVDIDPESFFLGPWWYRPFCDKAMSLLDIITKPSEGGL